MVVGEEEEGVGGLLGPNRKASKGLPAIVKGHSKQV